MKKYLKILYILATFGLLLLVHPAATHAEYIDALKGLRAGVMTGTPQDQIVNSAVEDADIYYFNNFSDICLALSENKIDFFVNSDVSFMMIQSDYPDFKATSESLKSFDLGTIFPKGEEGEKLRAQVNAYIKNITSDGKLAELEETWLNADEHDAVELPSTGENGTLRFATCSTMKPFSYQVEGAPSGFDIALIKGFCEEYGYGVKISDMDFQGVLSGIEAGKYDLAACQISYTEERAESVLFSDSYYTQHLVAIMRAADVSGNTDSTFTERICSSFYKTFIKENRWLTIVKGIANTFGLTVAATCFGLVIGFGIFILRTGKNRAAKQAAGIYIKILQGTPMVVLLLIMFYLIFGKSHVPAFVVAIVAFSLNFAAFAAEIIRSGVESIDKSQTEAALALGYTERQAFYNFVLPQAAVRFIPVMKGQIIALLKGTSVVGYIAILDLTRAADIIRSNTYEAFFPLISSAIIYFLLAWILGLVLDRIELSIDPRQQVNMKGGRQS